MLLSAMQHPPLQHVHCAHVHFSGTPARYQTCTVHFSRAQCVYQSTLLEAGPHSLLPASRIALLSLDFKWRGEGMLNCYRT